MLAPPLTLAPTPLAVFCRPPLTLTWSLLATFLEPPLTLVLRPVARLPAPPLILGRLWQGQGRCDEACTLLAEIYDWFTEGFDTADLREARELLEALTCKSRTASLEESTPALPVLNPG